VTRTVLTEIDGPVMRITINRPEVRNAIDLTVAAGIAAAITDLDGREELRVGILTGSGSTFCGGMDLKSFLEGGRPLVEGRGFAGIVERPPQKPLIAAVEGYAFGGGFEVTLACDLVVASRTALFSLPEVTRGLCAGSGGLIRLPRRVPYHIAMECALLGTPLTAESAAHFGLVNRLVDPGRALAVAGELAAVIASNGPMAVTASKEVIVRSQDWGLKEAFLLQEEIVGPVRRSADAREGASAFLEKRKPVWLGR